MLARTCVKIMFPKENTSLDFANKKNYIIITR